MRPSLACLLLLTIPLACTMLLSPDPEDVQTLTLSYYMAHGMALGYATGRDATPDMVLHLSALDKQAQASIQALNQPGQGDVMQAAKDIAALSRFVARQAPRTTADEAPHALQ